MNTSQTLMGDLTGVVAHLRQITVELRTADHAGGSGVIWRADGLIVTSAHVLASDAGTAGARGHSSAPAEKRAGASVVLADGRRLPSALVEWDRQLDLALLRVEAGDLPAAVVGDSDRLRPGELVLAVGHPLGMARAVAAGVLHAAPDRRHSGGSRWLQADLRLAPGNSGGPMADAGGRVVGVNAMIADGLALAVPSNVVRAFVRRCVGP